MFIDIFKKHEEEIEYHILVKCDIKFKTIDGEFHTFSYFNYIDIGTIIVSPQSYIMGIIKNEGYIDDDYCIKYPVCNIISIEFQVVDSVKIPKNMLDKYSPSGAYKTWYDDKQVTELKNIIEESNK